MEIRLISNGDIDLEDTITIDTSEQDRPVLIYGKNSIDSSDTARNDHLEFILRNRDWNIGPRLFLDKNGVIRLSLKDRQESPIPDMSNETEGIDFEDDGNFDILNDVNNLYNDAYRFGQDYYYKLLKIIRRSLKKLSDNSNNIEILERDYTGAINFNRFVGDDFSFDAHRVIYNIYPTDFMARVNIGYTYISKKTGLNKVSEEILIKPFIMKNNELVKINSRKLSKDKRILAEVYDGVLRLFPTVSEVRECFVQSCIIISEEYEKL